MTNSEESSDKKSPEKKSPEKRTPDKRKSLDTLQTAPSTSSAVVESKPKRNVVVLKTRIDGPLGSEQTIYLCGTSHVSRRSCQDVRELIQAVKPEVVMLELCDQRRNILNPVDKSKENMTTWEHLQLWREGKQPLLGVVYSWMLQSVADVCEIDPGEEFRVALEEAMKIGASVSLGDRSVSITLSRTWAALTRWQQLRLLFDILWLGAAAPGKELEELVQAMQDDEDVMTEAIKEFGESHPTVLRPLIEERDEYMVWALRSLAGRAKTIVAVVGAGHLKGMQEKWDSEIDIEEITAMPAERQASVTNWTHVLLVTSATLATIGSVAFVVHWRKLR